MISISITDIFLYYNSTEISNDQIKIENTLLHTSLVSILKNNSHCSVTFMSKKKLLPTKIMIARQSQMENNLGESVYEMIINSTQVHVSFPFILTIIP